MKVLTIFRTLGPIDLKSVRRDSLLAWMLVMPLGIALLFRWLVPQVSRLLAARAGFGLEPYYPLIMSTFLLYVPAFAGALVGFLLLDERDDRTLSALMVTPMPVEGYLFYRITAPVLFGTVMTLACYPIVGLVRLGLGVLLPVALLSSLLGPILALLLATFAANKVGGFALMKTLGSVFFIPAAAYFIPSGWQLLAGVVPTYWPLKAFWLAAEGSQTWWLYLVAGFAVNLAMLAVLLRRFNRNIYR